MLRGLIEQRYDQLWKRHKHRLSDGRSETHLQVIASLLTLQIALVCGQSLVSVGSAG